MFIALEGPEAAGKSTVIDSLAEDYPSLYFTREPTYETAVGQSVNQLIRNEGNLSDRTQTMLFLADRTQHIDEIVLPRLNDKKSVITDRYALSTIIYQFYAPAYLSDSNPAKAVQKYNDLHQKIDLPYPDCTIIFDLPYTVAKKRRDKANDKIEERKEQYHKAVHKGYRKAVNESWYPGTVRVKSDQSPSKVYRSVKGIIESKLDKA